MTKLEIKKIRGVKSDHAVNRLIEYNLVQEVGPLDAPGRPALFATTEEFFKTLRHRLKGESSRHGPCADRGIENVGGRGEQKKTSLKLQIYKYKSTIKVPPLLVCFTIKFSII